MHVHKNERREIEEERERCCCAGLTWIFQFSCSKHRSHSTPVRITAFGQPFCTLLFPSSSHCFIVIPFAAVISRGCSPWCSRPPPQGMPVLGWRVWFRGMKRPPPSSQPSGAVCSLLLLGIPVLRFRNLSQCSSQAATPPNGSGHRIMEWLWGGRDGHMLAPVSVPLCCWSGAKKL